MQGKTLSHLCVAALIMLVVILYTSPANAHSGGESGFSGKSGGTCTGCHSTGTPPTITLTGQTTVTSGTTNTYTVNVGGPGTRRGVDVATSAGTFTAGVGTTIQSGEITQSSPSASGSWTFTWTAPAVTTSTTATVWAAGVDSFGGGTGTLQQAITVNPASNPDFSLLATNATVVQGATGTSSLTVAPTNGFTGTINLSASGLPSGVTLSPSSVTGSSTLTLTATSAATTGTAAVTLTGTSGALTHTATFNVTVNAASKPDFSLSASQSILTIAQGASGTSTITVKDLNGFTGAVGLGASGMPSGVMASFSPSSTTSTSTLTLTAGSGVATGTSTVSITGTSGMLTHSVTLSLTVSGTSSGGALTVSPMSLTFNYQIGGRLPSSRTLSITSTGGSMSFTAKETDPWLKIAPASGTTSPGNPGSIRASVNPAGMAPGTYGAQININGTTISVPVALIITSGSGGCDNGCGGTSGGMTAQPYVSDSQSGTLAAAWVDNLGASPNNTSDPHNRGLVIAKSASAPADALAGATIQNVTGMFLTKLGFDMREGIQCSAGSLQFEVVTTQGKHTVDGCNSSTATQSSAAMGWKHFEFKPASAVPPIGSTDQVQSISIVLGKGTSSTGSIAVIDNIEINGVLVGKGTTSTSTSTSTSRDD